MYIKCTNNKLDAWNGKWTIPGLTLDKTYELLEYDEKKDESLILDDNQKFVWVEGWRFVG